MLSPLALELLQESLARVAQSFQLVVEHVPLPAVFSSPSRDDELIINRACEHLLGYRKEDINTHDKWFSMLHREDAGRWRQEYERAREARFPSKLLMPAFHKDGSQCWIE
eukprot:SM000022S07245  [mRNA]  locus=s22:732510:733005:- [translate_table: standard]